MYINSLYIKLLSANINNKYFLTPLSYENSNVIFCTIHLLICIYNIYDIIIIIITYDTIIYRIKLDISY